MTDPWRNRIVGYGAEPPGDLAPNPRNWRTHPQLQQEALAGVLADLGWLQNVIINRRTGNILDGHLRIKLAIQHEETSVPVTYVDLSDEEEALALVTFDPLGALAQADRKALDAVLRAVESDNVGVQEMLSALAKQEGLYAKGFGDFDEENERMAGMEEVILPVAVPAMYADQVGEWLANGEPRTGPGRGIGVMKRCGLL